MNRDKIKAFIYYICAFLLIFSISFKFHALDFDFWDRLIMGKCVVQTGSVCYNDIISFSNTHVWFDPEWLSSAFLYLVQIKFGIIGLISTKALFLFFIVAMINYSIRNLSNNAIKPYSYGYLLFLVFLMHESGIVYSTVRCQLLTFFLLALWTFFLEKIRNGDTKFLFVLPFVMLFWLNTHGACIAGLGVLFLYIIGEFLSKKPIKNLIFAFIACCLVFLINPWGVDYIKFIFDSSYLDRCWISEWQSTFDQGLYGFVLYKLLLCSCWAIMLYQFIKNKFKVEKSQTIKIIMLIVLTFLSIKHIKHIWLFVVMISIYYYCDIFNVHNALMQKIKEYLQIKDKSIVIMRKIKEIAFVLIILLFSIITLFKSYPNIVYDKNFFKLYPCEVAEFIKINNIRGNIFAPFHVSSFLAYKLYPQVKIYMDGRQEQVYDSDIFDDEMFFYNYLSKNPFKIFEKNKIDMFLVHKDLPIINHLSELSGYYLAYSANDHNLYLSNSIKRFNLIQPKINKRNYLNHLFDTNIKFERE